MAIKEKDRIIEVNTLEIPEELKELPQWVLWRAEWDNKQQEYKKVPYKNGGYKASSTRSDDWSSFNLVDEVLKNNDSYEGIGFVLSKDDSYVVLDIDNAIDENGQINSDLALEMTELTYCEMSPSGTGLHCFFKGELPEQRKKKRTDLDIELYNDVRFITVTGEAIGQSEICDEQEVLNNLVERYFKAEPKLETTFAYDPNHKSELSDDEVIDLMLKSKQKDKISDLLKGNYEKRFDSPSEAVQSLLHYLAFYTGKDKVQMERIFVSYNNLTDKWDSKRGNTTWGQLELDKAIANQSEVYKKTTTKNVKELLKELRKKELQHMRDVWEKEKEKGEAFGRPPQTIKPTRCAYLLNEHLNFILFDLEEDTKLAFYMENEGIYTQNYTYIRRVISWLEPKHNKRKADDVIYHLIHNYAPVTPRTDDADLIPVNNGVYNKQTKTLEPFTPKYVFTTKISTNYVANAPAPVIDGWNFDEWLYEIACADREVYTLLWQVINDSLNGNYTRKKAIFLVGDGNNGKGTFQVMLSNLIGFDNVASLKVNEFDQEFKLGVLEGKTLVIGDDVPVGVNIEDSSNFNSVVTGDSVLVNIKNKQPFRTVYRCTVIQSTNGMPRFKNKTGGTNRRLLIVPFNANFNGAKENPDIKEKYLNNRKVLEYILYKAINLDFKKFIVPQVSAKLLEEYKQDNDPVYDFKVTEFDTWKVDKIPKSVVYYRYKVFCENSGYHALSERKFYKSFNQYLSKNWIEDRKRFYSVADLQSKVGYFESTLVPSGELKRSYINKV
ncbi:phage/plasmid primase, P4 family [Staphylococcus haemolyticus]|uniref:phage/plasmid primase, P4 family n=1 Tax=Staphylococcus haemolyticus TaxID=1283 RepID=UPI0029047AC3|nr:phage/plasmid primase, P4 family [Staphylococcus haemolyticus]MDU0444735.1 phage/plasmid primase, P4 family [Staphylococcus haemolyticus]